LNVNKKKNSAGRPRFIPPSCKVPDFRQKDHLAYIAYELPVDDGKWVVGEPKTEKDRRRYYDTTFYGSLMIYGPNPNDCLRLHRRTREWERLVRKLVEALKQLSAQECCWLYCLLSRPDCSAIKEEKIPKSFFSYPLFRNLAKQCLNSRYHENLVGEMTEMAYVSFEEARLILSE
jgi:hypothetical protein